MLRYKIIPISRMYMLWTMGRLDHSILRPLAHLCDSLLTERATKLTFASVIMTAALLMVPVAAPVPAYADDATIDLWESFPDNQGDNGFRAYAYAPATNTYSLLSDCGSYRFCRLEEPTWNNPIIYRVDQPWVQINPAGTLSSAAGSPEDGVLAWVVQTTGHYLLNGSFSCKPGSGNGVDVYVKQNARTLWASYLPAGATQDYDIAPLLLNAGDTIYFGADAHNDTYFSELNDWVLVEGQIQRAHVLWLPLCMSQR